MAWHLLFLDEWRQQVFEQRVPHRTAVGFFVQSDWILRALKPASSAFTIRHTNPTPRHACPMSTRTWTRHSQPPASLLPSQPTRRRRRQGPRFTKPQAHPSLPHQHPSDVGWLAWWPCLWTAPLCTRSSPGAFRRRGSSCFSYSHQQCVDKKKLIMGWLLILLHAFASQPLAPRKTLGPAVMFCWW